MSRRSRHLGPTLRDEVTQDLASVAALKGATVLRPAVVLDVLALPGTLAVLGFRLAAAAQRRGHGIAAAAMRGLVMLCFGADLSPHAKVAPGLALPHPTGVAIGRNAVIGRRARLMGNVQIGGGTYLDPGATATAVVGDDCWLFDGAHVHAGGSLGNRGVLGTNAVTSLATPGDVISLGDPARLVKRRDTTGISPDSGAGPR